MNFFMILPSKEMTGLCTFCYDGIIMTNILDVQNLLNWKLNIEISICSFSYPYIKVFDYIYFALSSTGSDLKKDCEHTIESFDRHCLIINNN